MGDANRIYLFGGSEEPDLKIDYGHLQLDSKLMAANVAPYLDKFEIPANYITAVKAQALDNCWIYAATAMYEIYALAHGFAASNTEADAVMSENYMTYASFDTLPSDIDYKNPWGKQVLGNPKEYKGTVAGDGLAFFMRGDAHTPEVLDPLDPDTRTNAQLVPRLETITANKYRSHYVTGVKLLELPKAPYPDKKFIDDVKVNLLTYGAVTTAFYFAAARMQIGTDKRLACCCELAHPAFPAGQAGSHVVCIVGWDDHYPAANFNPAFQPKSDGAFLAKNSWGAGANLDGYLWISYEDETMGGACCITDMEQDFYSRPMKVVSHAGFGAQYLYVPSNQNQTTFRCVYETTGEDDRLHAIGLVCAAPCLADVSLTVGGNTTVLFQNILLEYAGYVVKKLSMPAAIGGKHTSYEICVTYRSVNSLPVAVPIEYNDQKYYTNVNLKRRICFIDGQDLADLAAADQKNYGNIVLTVILEANSVLALNAQQAYENMSVPASVNGRINGLCTDYGLAPVEWRLEPYLTDHYYPGFVQAAKKYEITDASGAVISQGISNQGTAAVPEVYLTAVIGETDEVIMRKTYKVSLDSPVEYGFTVSSVTDDNKVDLKGNFEVSGAIVNVSCNGQTGSAVTDANGNWELKNFELYDPNQGWQDSYQNSQVLVEMYDNQQIPVKLCSGSQPVVLSKPIEVKPDTHGGVIIAVIGGSIAVGIGVALVYAKKVGCAGCPVTINLCGKTYTVGRGFARKQGYTKFIGSDSGEMGTLELLDEPFDSIGGAENLNVRLGKVKVDCILEAENTAEIYYGGFAKEISNGGSLVNCSVTGTIESGGKSSVGACFGTGEDVTVENCRVAVQVTGAASCGGIAHTLRGQSTVKNCLVEGTLAAEGTAGGIAAVLQDGTISDCYVTADILGAQAAGITPSMAGNAQVRHCFVSGKIGAAESCACGIAPGMEEKENAVTQNVSVCAHISGDKIARVSFAKGTNNVAYAGMHCDKQKVFLEDGAVLKEWYAFGSASLYEEMEFDLTETWEFVDTLMFLRLRGTAVPYSYPFFLVASTRDGKFQVKVGSQLTLTGSKHADMAAVRWTGITPQTNANGTEEALWTSDNTFVLTVPFQPTQAGNFNLLLAGCLYGDDYSITLPLEVQNV